MYIYGKSILLQQHMYLGLKGKQKWTQQKFLPKNKPDELDEFIYLYTAKQNIYKKHMNINN